MDFSYKIFIINLKKRDDRKKNMELLFENKLNKEYFFYEAIDGQEIKLNIEIKNLFKNNDFYNRKSFIGCAMSHYNLWLELLKDNNNDYYVIFEDDIFLDNNFTKVFEKYKPEFPLNDILFLGYTKFNTNTNNNLEYSIVNLDRNNYMGGLFGYVITKSGAKKMIEYIERNNMKHGIDYIIKINNNIKLSVIEPNIVLSQCATNTNDVDSNIQRNYEGFNFNDLKDDYYYLFYKNLDQINNDYSHQKNLDINSLFDYCNKNIEANGFNTIGFVKSNIKSYDLSKSSWLSNEQDGIYVKMNKTINVSMICNFNDSKSLCDEFNNMSKGDYRWNNIKIVSDNFNKNNIDYYVIINKPLNNLQHYDPSKTIVFQMEPWIYNSNVGHGVHTWGNWAKPDPNKFLSVRSHDKYYNNCQSQLKTTYSDFMKNKVVIKTENKACSIVSDKFYDEGHILRVKFIKYLEDLHEENNVSYLDIYGRENYHSFKNYSGKVDIKDNIMFPYKYYFIAENNSEKNYITEKLWEAILSESLCFYWGAPNVSDYIDSRAFIQLDLNNFEESYKTIKNAIDNDLWSERIEIIREEKKKILNYYNFFPTIERIIMKDLWKDNLNIIKDRTKILILSNNMNVDNNIFKMRMDDLGLDCKLIKKNIDSNSLELESKLIYNGSIKYYNNNNKELKNKFINTISHISLYENLIKEMDDDKSVNYLILDEKSENISDLCKHPTLSLSNINNLLNHLFYLPENYDVCYISDSNKNKFKLVEKENNVYYKVKKYFFWGSNSYIISKEGIKKILHYLDNKIKCQIEELFYEVYNETTNFNFYSTINYN